MRHFPIGTIPAGGKISHWLVNTDSSTSSSRFSLRNPEDFELRETGATVRVAADGLYHVYAQVRKKSAPAKFKGKMHLLPPSNTTSILHMPIEHFSKINLAFFNNAA